MVSDWTERFAAVAVRNVSGLQVKKSQICWETGGRVGGNCWSWILFRRLSIRFRRDDMKVNEGSCGCSKYPNWDMKIP